MFTEQDSPGETSDSDNDTRTRTKRKGPRAKNSRPRKRRGSVNGNENANEDENPEEPLSFENFIYDAMLDPEVSIAEVATEWIESYKENEITALKDMINFILKVCFKIFFSS